MDGEGVFSPDRQMAFEEADAIMLDAISVCSKKRGRTAFIGLSGPQGSGKSTTASRLLSGLHSRGTSVVAFSIDDFYLTREERRRLAEKIHPLLITRGAPGTHDIALLEATVDRLSRASPSERTPVPAFDKSTDDRVPADDWPVHSGRPDVILIEGWCVGARPEPAARLRAPVNNLEAQEDGDWRWRAFVNAALAGSYARLFARIDLQIMLAASGFDQVFVWRSEQEQGLSRTAPGAQQAMQPAELRRFIAHYERLTRWMIEDEPADLVVHIVSDRKPLSWHWKS